MQNFPILVAAPTPPPLLAALAQIGPVHRLWEAPDREAALAKIAPDIRCLVWSPFGGALDDAFMARFPNLELVATMGAGYEIIDVAAAARRGLIVANTPHAVTEDTADAGFALILDTVRRFPASERYLRAGKWTIATPFARQASLRGKTLGILGYGRIGKAIARRAEAFGLSIVYHGRHRQDDAAHPYCATIEEAARASDILIAILPGGAGTHGAIGEKAFAALGSSGFFVNIGRGTSVDEAALVAALQTGMIAGAGLDVYADEPHVPKELLAMENVVLLPHVGGATDHVMQAVGAALVANVRAFAEGKGPLDPVVETPWPRK